MPRSEVTLFHPGRAAQEWVLDGAVHSGARATKQHESCTGCHERDAAALAERDFRSPKAPLLSDANRAPYDAGRERKDGDLLPTYGHPCTTTTLPRAFTT